MRRAPWMGAAFVALSCWACGEAAPKVDTRQLAPGVFFHEVALIKGPWAIRVIEVDLGRSYDEGVRLRSARAPAGEGGLTRTSHMAAGAVAAVNGDFYIEGTPVRTAGLQISGGELVQEPHGLSAFVLSAAGEPLIAVFGFGGGLITRGGQTLPIASFNKRPGPGQLALYNRYAHGATDSVRAQTGLLLQRLGEGGTAINDTVAARVVQIRRRAWPLRLQKGQWLVAAGSGHRGVDSIAPGDTVRLFLELPPARQPLVEAIGGGPRIVRNGGVSVEYEAERLSREFAVGRYPRTALGYSRDQGSLFLVAVDGRQPGYSVGMSLEELARFMSRGLAAFSHSGQNAYQALNLDGGGSTTMVVDGQVVNRPSDPTGESAVANALLVLAAPRP